MAIEQTQPTFRTSDGFNFPTLNEAERHEELFRTNRDFEAAKKNFHHALCKTQRTKDGQLFDFGYYDYYFVAPGWSRMPVLVPVSFSDWNFELEADTMTLIEDDGDKKRRYQLNTLYRDKSLAEAALVKAQWEWIEERASEATQTARLMGKDSPGLLVDELRAICEALLEPLETLATGVVPEWDANIERLREVIDRAKGEDDG